MRSRLALGFAVVLAACSGGGGSSIPTVPTLPWGSFRHDDGNSAVGDLINLNHGNVTLLVPTTQLPGTPTLSTPAIDLNNNLILGTSNGVASFGPDGGARWAFAGFEAVTSGRGAQTGCAPCADGEVPGVPPCLKVGTVSASPTVTAGNDIVFGTDGSDGQPGRLFVIHQNGNAIQCDWYFETADGSGIRSSALALLDALDRSIVSVYVGTDDGVLYVLNSDGSIRWSTPPSVGPITSTPTLDGNSNVYLATSDGLISAFTFSGAPLSPFPVTVGMPPLEPGSELQPSPAFGTSVYAVGAAGALFAIKPGQNGWQFTLRHCSDTITQTCLEDPDCPTGETCVQNPVVGSPAHLIQNFNFMATSVSDTVVYAVDAQGTAFGVRDLNADLFQSQLCSQNMNQDCRTDSCNPTGVQPPIDTCIASTHRCTISGQQCTQDSCVINNQGFCQVTNGIVSIAGTPRAISGSPVVSSDPFVIIGTTGPAGAEVCARSLGSIVPGQNLAPPTVPWRGGYCATTPADACVTDTDCPSGETCVAPAHCSVTTSQLCTVNDTFNTTCPSDQKCCPKNELCVFNGCVPLTYTLLGQTLADPGPVLSSPIIGENTTVYVTTALGLYVIK